MSHGTTTSITIVDLYELSAIIGRKFELLIDQYGRDAIAPVMTQVVHVLEVFEETLLMRENEEQQLFELKRQVENLTKENKMLHSQLQKDSERMEEAEATWQHESADMQEMVTKLSAENRNLKKMLKSHSVELEKHRKMEESTKEEIEILTKLKQTLDQQRVEIRNLHKELTEKDLELNAVQQQSTRLTKLNAALRHRGSISRQRSEELIESKSLLEREMRLKEQKMARMRVLLERHAIPIVLEETSGTTEMHSEPLLQEQPTMAVDITVQGEKGADEVPAPAHQQSSPLTEEAVLQFLKTQGKLVIDSKDPNRPRYTLQEFQSVLLEKTELKALVNELQEELATLKGEDTFDLLSLSDIDEFSRSEAIQARKSNEKGIKKFFSRLFTPTTLETGAPHQHPAVLRTASHEVSSTFASSGRPRVHSDAVVLDKKTNSHKFDKSSSSKKKKPKAKDDAAVNRLQSSSYAPPTPVDSLQFLPSTTFQ